MAYLIIAAATFGVMYGLDKLFTKFFRNQAQHHSGTAVRLKKVYGIASIALGLLAVMSLMQYILNRETLMPTVVLENRRENIYGEQTISVAADVTADVQFLPDFPRQRRTESGVELEYPGQFQLLCYDEKGSLLGTTARWEARQTLPAAENSRIRGVPLGAEAQVLTGNGRIQLKAELPVELTAVTEQPIPMVTGAELGQKKEPDPNRPSLILRRAGEHRLWDIAKATGSTMEAIRRANSLTGEPAPGQMLLIPVP